MEFLALVTWLVLAGTGAILAPFAFSTPGAGLAALAAFGGLTACILFVVLGAPLWAGWAQVGMAALGLVISGSVAEELQASVVGLQLPIYCALAFVTLLVATQGVDAVV
jgi:hypothetical protein